MKRTAQGKDKKFSLAEIYLLENWTDACRLEEGMKSARRNYAHGIEQAIRQRPWFGKDFQVVFTANGNMGFGRKGWYPGTGTPPSKFYPGFWLNDLLLDKLLTEETPPISAGIWLAPLKKVSRRYSSQRKVVLETASSAFKRLGVDCVRKDDEIWYNILTNRCEIRRMLREADGNEFLALVVKHADQLAELIPALDNALR